MSNSVRVILFDVGGVLVELSGVPTIQAWLGNRFTPEELWRLWLSSPIVRAFETGSVEPDYFANHLIADLKLPVSSEEFLEIFTSWPKGVFPGVLEVINRISPQYIRATLCNTNVLHWPRLMDEMGLRNLFAYHFASHLIGKLKPDREVFEHVVSLMECEPSAILFLDDQPLNVEAAQAIGIQAVCVRGVLEIERELTKANVLSVIRA